MIGVLTLFMWVLIVERMIYLRNKMAAATRPVESEQ